MTQRHEPHRARPHRPRVFARLLAVCAALAVAGSALTACSSEADWHPVTTDEAQVLALARFNNFDLGTRGFATEITVDGSELLLQGWVDFKHHVGYAAVTGEGFDPQTLLWWNEYVGLAPGEIDAEGMPPLPPVTPSQQAGWQVRGLEPSASVLDSTLAFIGALSSDRPENPLLLQQAGALWLGNERLEGDTGEIDVSVFAAPPQEQALGPGDEPPAPDDATVRLWVDEAGLLHRIEALIGGSWTTIDLEPQPGPVLEFDPELPGTAANPDEASQ